MKMLSSTSFGRSFSRCGVQSAVTGWVFAQQIRVVATFPDLADITRQIGKELVSVESLATGVEDPHGVPVRPSFVPRLNRADLLVVTGLDDEHSWLRRSWRWRVMLKFFRGGPATSIVLWEYRCWKRP